MGGRDVDPGDAADPANGPFRPCPDGPTDAHALLQEGIGRLFVLDGIMQPRRPIPPEDSAGDGGGLLSHGGPWERDKKG